VDENEKSSKTTIELFGIISKCVLVIENDESKNVIFGMLV